MKRRGLSHTEAGGGGLKKFHPLKEKELQNIHVLFGPHETSALPIPTLCYPKNLAYPNANLNVRVMPQRDPKCEKVEYDCVG